MIKYPYIYKFEMRDLSCKICPPAFGGYKNILYIEVLVILRYLTLKFDCIQYSSIHEGRMLEYFLQRCHQVHTKKFLQRVNLLHNYPAQITGPKL